MRDWRRRDGKGNGTYLRCVDAIFFGETGWGRGECARACERKVIGLPARLRQQSELVR